MNGMKKYVLSSTLTSAGWNNAEVVSGDVAGELAEIKAGDGGDIAMSGSGTTARWLLRNGLLDELNLLVHPVVVGDGLARLFPADEPAAPLALRSSETFKSGVLEPELRTGREQGLRGGGSHGSADRGHGVRVARRRDGGAGWRGFKYPGWIFAFDRGDDGNRFKLDETMDGRRAPDRQAYVRELRRRLAEPGGRVRRQVQHDAQVRRLDDAGRAGVEQHHGARRATPPPRCASSRSGSTGAPGPGSHQLVQELIATISSTRST